MLYREYGKTGKKVSTIGFGGMRFEAIDNHEACVEMMVEAAKGGINYFDTAPKYFGTKSEEVFGKGFKELRSKGYDFLLYLKNLRVGRGQNTKRNRGPTQASRCGHHRFLPCLVPHRLGRVGEKKEKRSHKNISEAKGRGAYQSYLCLQSSYRRPDQGPPYGGYI